MLKAYQANAIHLTEFCIAHAFYEMGISIDKPLIHWSSKFSLSTEGQNPTDGPAS